MCETEEEFVTLDKVCEREREKSSSLLSGKEFVPLNTGVCVRDRRGVRYSRQSVREREREQQFVTLGKGVCSSEYRCV